MNRQNQLFLITQRGQTVYTYADFIQAIAQENAIPKHVGQTSLFKFYVHLVAAIVHNLDVIILDPDFSAEEICLLTGKTDITQEKLPVVAFGTLSENILLQKIHTSSATLTLFTSGTTGQPKKITHPVSSFLRSVREGEKFRNNIWALAYNPTHMAGLQVFFQALLNLNPLIDVFGLSKEQVLHLMRQYGVTHISATPTFYRMLMPPDFQMAEIQRVTLGGEKSSPVLYEQLRKIFPNARLTNIYASTEAGALFYAQGDIFETPEHMKPFVKVEHQKLFLSKKILGYSDYSEGEWYDTGDLVEIVNENPLSFRFVSRSNEMLNVGGNKVNPAEVEDMLLQHEKIKNARVYGQPNSVLGTMLIAEIQVTAHVSVADIRKFLTERLQDYKVPRIIRIVEKVATTRSGKVKRANQ